MGHNISCPLRRGKKFSLILMVVIAMLLSSMVITACEGNCNGVGNCSCNGDATCNGNGGSVPVIQQSGQQAHHIKPGGSGLVSRPSQVNIPLSHFRTFLPLNTSHKGQALGLRFQRGNT